VSNLLIFSIPGFLTLLALEVLWTSRRLREGAPGLRGYETKDTFASLAMGVGNVVISALTTLGAVALWTWAYRHRALSLGQPTLWWSWLLLFFAEDFATTCFIARTTPCACCGRRTSTITVASTSICRPRCGSRGSRQSPVRIFWLPLALLGYPPPMILTAEAISLIYQFWIHTETVRKLPWPLEWLFNTPSHHRVHHGKNVRYLDRNHGGVLIVWDRLFGTFTAEDAREPVAYGITHDLATFNPLRIAVARIRGSRPRPATGRLASGRVGLSVCAARLEPGWLELDGRPAA